MRRLLAVTVLVSSLTACSTSKSKPDPGPTCAQVVDNMLVVTRQQLTGHGDMELGNRKAMIAQCEQRALSADQRRCLVAAKSLDAIATCTPGKPRDGAPRTPPPPAP